MSVAPRDLYDAQDVQRHQYAVQSARARLITELPGDDPDFDAILDGDEETISRRVASSVFPAADVVPPNGPVLVRLQDVQREMVAWQWDAHLAHGKLHLVDGDPDLGKTTMTLDIAARVTRGGPMPDGTPSGDPAGVVILGAEDGLADTVRPRLEAAGADLSRIVALTAIVDDEGERLPALPLDLAAVEMAVQDVDAALVIIDPLMAFLDGTVNSWRDQDVRRALAPLAKLAERTGCAIVCIRHLNKSTGSHAMYRGGGSIGIVGAARIALLVARDPDDEDRRVVATIKNNLAPHPPSLAFRLVSTEIGAARIEWLGESAHNASALLAIPSDPSERGALDDACDALQAMLADGPMAAKDAEREAYSAGITRATLLRARKAAGVIAERVGGLGRAGGWQWRLDAKALNEPLRHSLSEDESLRPSMSPLGDRRSCATCGAAPVGTFRDGSPRYDCGPHDPIFPGGEAA